MNIKTIIKLISHNVKDIIQYLSVLTFIIVIFNETLNSDQLSFSNYINSFYDFYNIIIFMISSVMTVIIFTNDTTKPKISLILRYDILLSLSIVAMKIVEIYATNTFSMLLIYYISLLILSLLLDIIRLLIQTYLLYPKGFYYEPYMLYHEAGHCVGSLLLESKKVDVYIWNYANSEIPPHVVNDNHSVEKQCIISYCGFYAEQAYSKLKKSSDDLAQTYISASNDIGAIFSKLGYTKTIINDGTTNKDVIDGVIEAAAYAEDLIKNNWDLVEMIASELRQFPTLNHKALSEIYNEYLDTKKVLQ